MTTFRSLLRKIKTHRDNGRTMPNDRPPQDHRFPHNVLKFLPVPSEVYRQLGADFGQLPVATQGPIAMLHFRLEMVTRDIERISRYQRDNPLDDAAILQIAQRLHDACQPAVAALRALEEAVSNSEVLRKQLEVTLDAAAFPVEGSRVVTVLEQEKREGRPDIPGLNPHLS